MNIAKFVRTAVLWNTSGGCSCQFDEVTVQYWAAVSTKRVVDLARVCSLHVISSNHSYKFLLINLQKRKSKVKHCRAISSNIRVLMDLDRSISMMCK